jgi:hypothetical protein
VTILNTASPELKIRGSEERAMVAKVLALIQPRRGREAAISMHEISTITGIGTRVIQAIVKFLVEERHWPIGTAVSRPYGYFRIANNEERRAVRNHFVRRALSNLEHARAYDSDAIVAPLVGQIAIDFPEVKR